MKAATLSSRPHFSLMKQTDVQSFYHLQMPRWLFFDKKYMSLSLEAKVTYTFLLNRFQLSKLNNWINSDGEVFIIYTRESLAAEIQISYRRAIDCMKELANANLVWEKRCGRGAANQIYLAKVELSDENASTYTSTPFVSHESEEVELRPAEFAYLDSPCEYVRPTESAHKEVPNLHIKTCENGSSRSAKLAHLDLQFPHTNNKDFKKIYKIDTDISQSVCQNRAQIHFYRRTDDEIVELKRIIDKCELWVFSESTAKVFENAIERLYFSESYRIGNCILPQQKVRSHLWALESSRLQDAERKISQNTNREIKNTTAYVMAVIFNSIWESESDLMCDPYLNSMRILPFASGGG